MLELLCSQRHNVHVCSSILRHTYRKTKTIAFIFSFPEDTTESR